MRVLPVVRTATYTLAGPAQFTDRNKAQAQCELSTIRDTRSPIAIASIPTTCNWLAINTGSLNESNRRFYTCLVQSLSGVQSDAAANQIISASDEQPAIGGGEAAGWVEPLRTKRFRRRCRTGSVCSTHLRASLGEKGRHAR